MPVSWLLYVPATCKKYLEDGSTETNVLAAIPHITISLSHGTLTPGQPLLVLELYYQANHSLCWNCTIRPTTPCVGTVLSGQPLLVLALYYQANHSLCWNCTIRPTTPCAGTVLSCQPLLVLELYYQANHALCWHCTIRPTTPCVGTVPPGAWQGSHESTRLLSHCWKT